MEIRLRDYSPYPYGRYRAQSEAHSGEAFREDVLLPAFRGGADQVFVILDGARGLGSSFLEEAFGGLIRSGLPFAEVKRRLTIVSDTDPSLTKEVWGYINDAARMYAADHAAE